MKPFSLTLLISLALATALPACSSSSPGSGGKAARALSSAKADPTLDSFLESADPRGAAKSYVMRLLKIRIRAHAWLREFDLALLGQENSIDIFSLPAYQRLLLSRPLTERTQEKIVEIYKDARTVSLGNANDPEGKAREGQAFLVVAGIRDALREVRKNKAQRVLLHRLMREMKETFEAEGGTAATDLDGLAAPFQGNALGEAAKEAEGDIQQMIKELPETDDIKEEIDAEATEFDEQRKDAESREPSAAAKFPSITPSGNVQGTEFPMGTFALTFDDGPDRVHTMNILASLQANGIKGSFFWITNWAKGRPAIVKAVQSAGMTVANHSYMHAKILKPADLARLHTTVEKEIITSTQEFTRIYGYKPRFFRLPYAQGMNDNRIRALIAGQGMIHVKWNIDSNDWDDPNPASVLARTELQMRQTGRGIVLFHDVHPQSVAASRSLMQRKRGQVRWVTIEQIVDELNANKN